MLLKCRNSKISSFLRIFGRNMLLPWHLAHLHVHPKANIWAKFHENRSKTEEVVHDARFVAIICCYHGNTLSATLKKLCLAHLHPKANMCSKFQENWSKTEEVVRDARLAPDRPPDSPTDDTLIPIPPYTLHYVYAGV